MEMILLRDLNWWQMQTNAVGSTVEGSNAAMHVLQVVHTHIDKHCHIAKAQSTVYEVAAFMRMSHKITEFCKAVEVL